MIALSVKVVNSLAFSVCGSTCLHPNEGGRRQSVSLAAAAATFWTVVFSPSIPHSIIPSSLPPLLRLTLSASCSSDPPLRADYITSCIVVTSHISTWRRIISPLRGERGHQNKMHRRSCMVAAWRERRGGALCLQLHRDTKLVFMLVETPAAFPVKEVMEPYAPCLSMI